MTVTAVRQAEQAPPVSRDGLIPTPPVPQQINIAGTRLNTYGLIMGTGGVVGASLFSRVAAHSGVSLAGKGSIAVPVGLATLAGARLFHVAINWEQYRDRPGAIPAIWDGGNALFGGLAAGTAVGAVLAHRAGLPVATLLDAAAVGIPVAQAIGRWGNYVNEELYGTPTDLPWGMQVSPSRRPADQRDVNSFHPTFLYESIYDAALGGGLYALSKRWKGRPPGALFAMYLAGYGVGRFAIESVKQSDATPVLGLRPNQWASLAAVAVGGGYAAARMLRHAA